MPRCARPANSEYAEDPVKTLGSMVNASVIGYLRQNPGQTRAEIAEGLELAKMSVANVIETLMDAELIIADPPRDVALRAAGALHR